jgi:hypothetical protein
MELPVLEPNEFVVVVSPVRVRRSACHLYDGFSLILQNQSTDRILVALSCKPFDLVLLVLQLLAFAPVDAVDVSAFSSPTEWILRLFLLQFPRLATDSVTNGPFAAWFDGEEL